MSIRPFETLDRLRKHITEALISQSGLRSPGLAHHLRQELSRKDGAGTLIPPPVLEGAFPFVPADVSMSDLAGSLLAEKTVTALAGDDTGQNYSFPRTRFPYRHQVEAWQLLLAEKPRSVVVSAGTGSGKTECFLVPMLDSLYRRSSSPNGVEAIMLYPLNALIASQQERLDAWTKPAGGKIRYCLYNGYLPEALPANSLKARLVDNPQQVPDRKTLRSNPPPLLVTNLTMLEYLLVRPTDQPIITASHGKLKWIVLDEAHTYVGSAAAEVSLLLRRVMDAFHVDPSDVRFVATSATIGEGERVGDQLRAFLADVAGIDVSQVSLVTGGRQLPTRPKGSFPAPTPESLLNLSQVELYDRLGAQSQVWQLVERLKTETVPAVEFEQVSGSLGVDGEALAMAMTKARSSSGETLAPLRVHSFHRPVPGLWCCTDPQCLGSIGNGFNAGKIHFDRRDNCHVCKMPVAEVYTCNECGGAFMVADEIGDRLVPPKDLPPEDEFLFDADRETAERDEDSDAATHSDLSTSRHCFALGDAKGVPIFVDRATGRTADGNGAGRYRMTSLHGGGKGRCPACNAGSDDRDKLYPFRFGAPFIIGNAAPILLEAMPPAEGILVPPLPQTAPDLPSNGRQLISFTDSRQGTARMAAKLESESERAFIRSFVYQTLQHGSQTDVDIKKLQSLKKRVTALKAIPDWQENPNFGPFVAELETEIADMTGDISGIGWEKLVAALSDRREIRDWLPEVWGDRSDLFRSGLRSGAEQLSEALLLRELMRRPKVSNSLETMGLAQLVYPVVDKITAPPNGFSGRGGTLYDWKAWLACLLQISIRTGLAVHVKRDLLQWIVRHGLPKTLAAPEHEARKNQQKWPRASDAANLPQVVKLLCLGLGMNKESKTDLVEMNEWLGKAWNQLFPLFTQNANGELALDFRKLEVGPVRQAYFCPVTRTIVNAAPFGLSPFARTREDRVEAVAMPNLPADGDDQTRRAFLAHDEKVARLRERGLWRDLHDRIALFSPYFRSAEHSAQLSPTRLRHYEAEFKQHKINLLNCSTTMEMGVDIGSVNGVMMTNVPPSIANYRQRVGRAGRRGQPLSLSFTFAKDRPLDWEAFNNPPAYLKSLIAAPKVALDSEPIVQRHVNALLLGRFMAENSGNLMNLAAGDFFGCPKSPNESRLTRDQRPVANFIDWLALALTSEKLQPSIDRLVSRSVLAGRSNLLFKCKEAVVGAEKDFVVEWEALQQQARGAVQIGAEKAIKMHLTRLCGEFLLSDLADRAFLPGHGFPNNVVSFELDRSDDRMSSGPDDDRRGRRHGGPKRSLDIAIRDYAPGSETVVDGQVYRVGGVTLNWQRPSSVEGVTEIQAIRWAARCKRCGDNWTILGARPEECRTCGEPAPESNRYLKPAGFLRDRHAVVHAEIDRVDFIRPEAEGLSAGAAQWEVLSNPAAGRLRFNRRGTVFYHTKGPKKSGYGLCLACGRMEPAENIAGVIRCDELVGHKPLRSEANFSQSCIGNASPFAIQLPLDLGHEIHTDVLELQPAKTASPAAANAIGVAIRDEIARFLGVDPDEMGFGISPTLNSMANKTTSIFLYDRAAGGAGYVARGAEEIRQILRNARSRLDCPRQCESACSACVLASDAPEGAELLDRHKAIAFLDEHFVLPDRIAPADVFTVGADISDRPRHDLDEWLSVNAGAHLRIWIKPIDVVSLDGWPLSAVLKQWTSNNRNITLVMPPNYIGSLDSAQILFLRDYCSRTGVLLAEGEVHNFQNGGVLLASGTSHTSSRAWACRDTTLLEPKADWGADNIYPVCRADMKWEGKLSAIDHAQLIPPADAIVVELDQSLDGSVAEFGNRMSKALRKALGECGILSGDGLVDVSYQDRFCRSPIVIKFLCDTVARLSGGQGLPVTIHTAPDKSAGGFARNQVISDVDDDVALTALVQVYGKRVGLNASVRIGQPPHKRSLTLRFASGKSIIVDLDQGFGWLNYEGNDRYVKPPIGPQTIMEQLVKLAGKVKRRHDHNSQMVVWRQK